LELELNRGINIMLSTLFHSPSGKLVVVDGGWTQDGEFLLMHDFVFT